MVAKRYSPASAALICLFTLSPILVEGATNISLSPQWVSSSPRLAVDLKGNVHVAWLEIYSTDRGDVFYSQYDSFSQTWSSPLNLSSSSQVYCDSLYAVGIAVDSSNRVYVVWVENNQIKLRIKDGSWGEIYTVSSGGNDCDSPRIAVTPDGSIYITWWSLDGVIWSRARVSGNWESVRVISDTGRRSKFPDIAVGNNIVVACWVEKSGELYQTAFSQRSRGLNAGWSAPLRVAPSSFSQQHAVIELDPQDRSHLIWTSVLSESGLRVVHYASGTINGFSSPLEISSVQVLHYPSLAEMGGNLYACWQVGAYGSGLGVFYNIFRGGKWTGEAYLPDSSGVTFCDVAVPQDESGVYFVWDAGGEVYFAGLGAGPTPNKPPVANFTYSPQKGEAPLTVNFDASLSYDPDGQIVRYDWDFGDGSQATGKIVSHTFSTPGLFSVRLTVTDDKGKIGLIIKVVEVLKPNQPPVASFNFSPTTGLYPLEVTFDGGPSFDPDGEVVGYNWDFGDGAGASGRVVRHTYSSWGVFTVRLTVYDDRNASASTTRTLEVLRLFQPLNIRWETRLDEGLFLTRYVTDVRWDPNPKNNEVVAKSSWPIVAYRVYRKKTAEDDRAYQRIAEVKADTFFYRDSNVGGVNLYAYTVTACDNAGHESPIEGVNFIFTLPQFDRNIKKQNRDAAKRR
ncbi:MAG: PKD domain-containing protein [Candidatus Aminicenantales bacterium]